MGYQLHPQQQQIITNNATIAKRPTSKIAPGPLKSKLTSTKEILLSFLHSPKPKFVWSNLGKSSPPLAHFKIPYTLKPPAPSSANTPTVMVVPLTATIILCTVSLSIQVTIKPSLSLTECFLNHNLIY